MSGRRIILVNCYFFPDHSATAQLLTDLAVNLVRKNHRVTVLTTNGLYDAPDAELNPYETCHGVEVHRVYRPRFGRQSLPGRALDYFLMYLIFAKAVFQMARRGDLIVAKTDPPLVSVVLLPIALLKGAKLVNWLQDLYPEVAVAFGMKALVPLMPLLALLRGLSLRHAHCNVVIGCAMESRLQGFGVAAERISVIPNWCTQDDIRPLGTERNTLRLKWGLDGKFVVAYSGNLGRAHETATLLDCAEKLRDERELVFLFIGGGALSATLRAEVRRRGLDALFAFQPYQPASLLRESLTLPDVFWVSLRPEMEGLIVPSKFYGNCAAGRPTIFVGDLEGEIARLVEAHQCGLNVPVGDAQRLADAILFLKNDSPRLEAMGRNARQASETALSKQASLASWQRLIEAVIGGTEAGPPRGVSSEM
jgi:glycosyltransferase involved in cell wall biosynthesis